MVQIIINKRKREGLKTIRLSKNLKRNVIMMVLVTGILCTACQKENANEAAENMVIQESSVAMETVSSTEEMEEIAGSKADLKEGVEVT